MGRYAGSAKSVHGLTNLNTAIGGIQHKTLLKIIPVDAQVVLGWAGAGRLSKDILRSVVVGSQLLRDGLLTKMWWETFEVWDAGGRYWARPRR